MYLTFTLSLTHVYMHVYDEWLSEQTDTIQAYAMRKYMRNFYSNLKAIYGLTSSGSSPLLSADRNTLISKDT